MVTSRPIDSWLARRSCIIDTNATVNRQKQASTTHACKIKTRSHLSITGNIITVFFKITNDSDEECINNVPEGLYQNDFVNLSSYLKIRFKLPSQHYTQDLNKAIFFQRTSTMQGIDSQEHFAHTVEVSPLYILSIRDTTERPSHKIGCKEWIHLRQACGSSYLNTDNNECSLHL